MRPIWLDEQISSLTFTMQWTFCPATFGCPAILFKSFMATERKSEKFEISQFLNFFPVCQVGGCCEGNITYAKNLSHLTFARYLLAKFLTNPFDFHGLLNFVTNNTFTKCQNKIFVLSKLYKNFMPFFNCMSDMHKQDIKNYRPVTVLKVIRKVFEQLLSSIADIIYRPNVKQQPNGISKG